MAENSKIERPDEATMTVKEPEIGHEYHWKNSESWKWVNGQTYWWEVFVEFRGMNGCGGYWIEERWRWNGSDETLQTFTRSLSYADSIKMISEIGELNG